MLVVAAVVCLASFAHADPATDASKAFSSFADAVAAKKLPDGVEAFIGPQHDPDVAVTDPADVLAIVPSPKLKIVSSHVAKSGTAAWVVAAVPGAKYDVAWQQSSTQPLRASAFLTLDGGTWHVRAVHWSGGVPNRPRAGGCGNMDIAYEPPDAIAKGAEPAVKLVRDAFLGAEYRTGKLQTGVIVSALSDDKAAQMFGSAPDEMFIGGATIKSIFKKWKVDLRANSDHTRAGIAPGGDLAWVATEVASDLQCTPYRTLFVLQLEGGKWKIVHMHFSSWVSTR